MIFDNDNVTHLVLAWQETSNPNILEEIMTLSNSLIEAIVSGFDYHYRDDLIQEARMKVIHALPAYDVGVANLHTYMTTVIRNACISWLSKYDRHEPDIDDLDIFGAPDHSDITPDMLTGLITRNRARFPSLPVDMVDDITHTVFSKLRQGVSKTKIIQMLSGSYNRSLVTVIVSSTIVYLRMQYVSLNCVDTDGDGIEFTLLPELKELIGDKAYKHISIVFSGFIIKTP